MSCQVKGPPSLKFFYHCQFRLFTSCVILMSCSFYSTLCNDQCKQIIITLFRIINLRKRKILYLVNKSHSIPRTAEKTPTRGQINGSSAGVLSLHRQEFYVHMFRCWLFHIMIHTGVERKIKLYHERMLLNIINKTKTSIYILYNIYWWLFIIRCIDIYFWLSVYVYGLFSFLIIYTGYNMI